MKLESEVKTKDGTQYIVAFSVEDYPLSVVHFAQKTQNKKRSYYCEEFAVFDSETSHDADNCGWVYQWAFLFNGTYCYGRTPSEFIELLERIQEHYKLSDTKRIIIYIHNASYDLQYLKQYLKQYDTQMKALAIDNHTILTLDVFGFRFLCSYKLTNMSLDLLSKSYADNYRKAVGAINYNVVRYQDTELTETDWMYMFSDVASQHEAIEGYLKVNGYEFAHQAPITSTGFVRSECRKAAAADRNWREQFKASALTLEQYNLCRAAFMGGITIASYDYSGETVENVGHIDFTSSYPARQMMDYFPVGKPTWYGEIDTMEEFESLCRQYCCVFILHLDGVHIKAGVTAPYIPSSKCITLEDELKVNGKVVYAKSLSMAMTEIDWKWIKAQYNAEAVRVTNMLIFSRGQAPAWLKEKAMQYFRNKCTLKHSDPRLYMASKALLNAIYGMSATTLIRDEYELGADCIISHKEDSDPQKALEKYYNSYNSFMPYQLGIYTTAHARNALMTAITTIGYDNFLYCDTDSEFYMKSDETEEAIEKLNEKLKSRAIESGAYVGDKYLGYAEHEEDCKKFRALHAKCYALEDESGLHVTIAGIPKASTKWIDGEPVTKSNAEELGKLDNLQDGFIFRHCGGTRSLYIECEPRKEMINGHMTEYASSVIIENIEKEISDTMYTVGKDYSLLHIQERSAML